MNLLGNKLCNAPIFCDFLYYFYKTACIGSAGQRIQILKNDSRFMKLAEHKTN